ncbi:MAG TPA: hypothetical protein VE976_00780 [Actinomycetota bacterium]|nr:hypothetical protein [Actinomycetota bacterium]
MSQDPLIARLAEVDRACADMQHRIDVLRDAVSEIQQAHASGEPVSEIVTTGRGARARRELRRSWLALNRALHGFRAEEVRSLIDQEGLTVAEAARRSGNARQVISRLYHSA